MANFNSFKRSTILFTAVATALLTLNSCEKKVEPTPGTGSQNTNKTAGFVITGRTSSNSVLVKYFENIPTGTVDLSDGNDYPEFFPNAIYNHAMFMGRTDGSAGFAKMVINKDGEIVEEANIPVADVSSFRIDVKDDKVGVFHDRATPNTITVFDPTTFKVTRSIDMKEGVNPNDTAETRYQNFIFRGDDFFSMIRENVSGSGYQGIYLHQGNVASNEFVGSTYVERPNSGGVGIMTVNNFGQNYEDDNGDLYFHDGGAIGTGKYAQVYKIPSGSDEIDQGYVFNPTAQLDPTNIFLPYMWGFRVIGNGKAIAICNSQTPQAAIDLLDANGGVSGVLSDPALLDQVFGILFTAESAAWCELDLIAQTVTPISGAPKLGAFSGSGITFEHEGAIYFPIANAAEVSYYKYTPGSGSATKAFDITGGDNPSVFNIAINN